MKKRKRKMEEKRVAVKRSQVALLISSSFVIILIINSILLTIIANTAVVHCDPTVAAAATAAHFDEEHHRLNLSQSTSGVGGSNNGNTLTDHKIIIIQTETVPTNPSVLFNNANRSQQVNQANLSDSLQLISQQQQQQQCTNNKSEISNDNSIIDNNDLLAVESGHHLSSVAAGSQTKQLTTQAPIREQQTNPPYASNISATSHYARLLNNSLETTRTTLQPLNETSSNYLSKLYRAKSLPTFLQDQQQHLTTNKDSPTFYQPTAKHSHQFNLHNYTTTGGLKFVPSQQQQASNHNNQATSSNVSLPITSSWHSLYYSPSVLATKQAGRPAIGSSSSVQVTTKAAAAATDEEEKEEGKYTTHQRNIDNNLRSKINISQVEHESELSKTTSSSSPFSSTPHQINTNQQTISSITNFPSLLSSNGELEGEEEKFERTLAIGNYQRTNNTKNMSWSQLLRQATENNVMESLMVTNKSIVSLSCDTNDMLIRFKFKQPFKGSVVTNLDKSKSCRLLGTGGYYYEMKISLNDCGTRQEMPRLFINNIQIEFQDKSSLQQNSFDFVENEIKTIICSYPIKPRAPPPPDLPFGLSERIIEQATAPNEPAKLVYYEPLVLISGLLFLSLTLLGLTMSAYMLAKRFKSSRSTNLARRIDRSTFYQSNNDNGLKDDNGFISSSRLYRNSPAQIANFSFLSPPLIGSEDDINKRKFDKIKAQTRKLEQNYKTIPDERGRKIRANMKRYSDSGNSFSISNKATIETTKNKSLKHNNENKQQVTQNGFSTINLNPNDSPDSLADKNDRSSITTIEIPFSSETRLSEPSNTFESLNRIVSSKEIEEEEAVNSKSKRMMNRDSKPTSPPPLPPPEFNKLAETTRRKHEIREEEGRNLQNQAKKEEINDHERLTRFRSTKKSSQYYKSERLTRRKYPRVQSKEVQAGGDTPPFGSFRSKLTSPREFKRLQEITRMFEEVIVEKVVSKTANKDDNDGGGGKVVHKIDIKPSKYKSKILDQVEESERHLLANMLTKDELFRSLVVDSTNKETFDRKLKGSPTYGEKFSESTWKLLEEILLDQDINSFLSSPSGIDSNQVINHIDSSSNSAPDDDNDTTKFAENNSRQRVIKVITMNDHHNQQQHVVVSESHSMHDKDGKFDNKVKSSNNKGDADANSSVGSSNDGDESVLVEINAAVAQQPDSHQGEQNDSLNSVLQEDSDDNVVKTNHTLKPNNNSPKSLPEPLTANRELQSTTSQPTTNNKVHHKDTVRVSQFNSTTKEGGMTGTLINIDSVTNFTSSKDFSTFTKSRIEHTRYDVQDDSLPSFGHIEKVNSYEYANETIKSSPKFNNNTFSRKMLKKPPAIGKSRDE